MTFEIFMNQAWGEHAQNPHKVAERLKEGGDLVEGESQAVLLANLICHVIGTHLGDWQRGLNLISALEKKISLTQRESKEALQRSIWTLKLASGETLPDIFSHSDRIRIKSAAAAALLDHNLEQAEKLFHESIMEAENLNEKDPANKALAIAGNNLASALEEKSAISENEKKIMITAAQTARRFWEIAGTWLEVERAEYRLASSFLRAENYEKAESHAKACARICARERANALELFFAYEILARIEKAQKKDYKNSLDEAKKQYSNLSEQDKGWCLAVLEKIES